MSNDFDIFIKLLLSMALGFVIGLERNTTFIKGSEKLRLGGVRTFVLISLLGALSGITFASKYEILTYLTFVFMIILVLISYVLYFLGIKSLGVTTEVATIISFLVGFAVTSEFISIKITLAVVIIIAFILSQKEGIHELMEKVNRDEVGGLIKFAVIALVILPFLPDIEYRLGDIIPKLNFLSHFDLQKFYSIEIINLYKIWFIVVLITGLRVSSYYLTKFFGNKNTFILTTFFSGFVSSTSLLVNYASRTKEVSSDKSELEKMAGGALIAHGSSFVTILLLTLALNYQLFKEVALSFSFMAIISMGIGFYFITKSSVLSIKEHHILQTELFSLKPALKFIFILTIVSVCSQLFFIQFGSSGFYLSTIFSALAGMDPIVVSLSEFAGNEVTLITASLTFLGAVGVNALWKIIYSRIEGEKIFYRLFSIGLVLSYLAGSLLLFVLFL